jgi:hypothetical protein
LDLIFLNLPIFNVNFNEDRIGREILNVGKTKYIINISVNVRILNVENLYPLN